MIGKSGDRKTLAIVLLAVLLLSSFALASESGAICVAPLPKPIPIDGGLSIAGDSTVTCASGKYSVKIDTQKSVLWPTIESVKIEDLNPSERHRVVVLCDTKPLQSFTFKFAEYKTKKLCLFLNDLYWTVQLWDSKQSPWCKCK